MDALKKEIEGVKRSFLEELKQLQSPEQLGPLRERYFSRRQGIVTGFFNRLREIPADQKPQTGKEINNLKLFIEEQLQQAEAGSQKRAAPEWHDFTLPEIVFPVGRLHLITHLRQKVEAIFLNMGYDIADGPEVETEFNNFTALNMPDHHPARDEHDTFFIDGSEPLILRTHTSPVQIRYMLSHPPPIKIIVPGKVCRKDNPDATHTPVFHQVEGLLVDRGIHFSHLKGTLELFVHSLFGEEIRMRFRPGYFPFTEPSAEVDISCFLCSGRQNSCPVCKGKGWLEILGSGMVHPQVLRNCRIDPDTYSGFAFGMGIERMAIIRYGIPDLRLLFENDLRLSGQFD